MRYLIAGNGVAGTTAAEQIRKYDPEGEVAVVTEEDVPFYYRLRLNEFIAGEIDVDKLIAKKENWYREQRIDLKLGVRLVGGDPSGRTMEDDEGGRYFYDRLLIATGSHSFIPPVKGADVKGVYALRSISDARAIVEAAGRSSDCVLIGGGLLGLEAGNALRKMGKKVCVVEFFPRLLPRQLDEDGARLLQQIMEDMGFSFRLGAKTGEIAGADEVKRVELEGGESLPAQMVVVSAGVRPNLELADSLGLDKDKGIKVDDRLQTSVQDIFAAGDVTEYRGIPYGIWPAAMEQGKIAGANMAGGSEQYSGTTMANTLKVVGVDLASAGDIDAEGKLESKTEIREGVYRKIVLDGGVIKGCIMLGDTRGFNEITRAMKAGKDVSGFKDRLVAGGFDFSTLKN
ncbi:MAG TPA: NAD(P)/FAD-dependent oxidoreductase [Desulfobacteraceae bacterium]|nr:NAD(P)/FAD-dependent oxidoreductase [Desulfobacteraceae bacterium]